MYAMRSTNESIEARAAAWCASLQPASRLSLNAGILDSRALGDQRARKDRSKYGAKGKAAPAKEKDLWRFADNLVGDKGTSMLFETASPSTSIVGGLGLMRAVQEP